MVRPAVPLLATVALLALACGTPVRPPDAGPRAGGGRRVEPVPRVDRPAPPSPGILGGAITSAGIPRSGGETNPNTGGRTAGPGTAPARRGP
jgi:hypothetical protein